MWGWEQLYFNIKDGYLGESYVVSFTAASSLGRADRGAERRAAAPPQCGPRLGRGAGTRSPSPAPSLPPLPHLVNDRGYCEGAQVGVVDGPRLQQLDAVRGPGRHQAQPGEGRPAL
jgi:hypothetical protein